MPGERQHYRVFGVSADEISVAVTESQENPIPAQIVDLSVGGMGVVLDQESAPFYMLGETVYVHIASPLLDEAVVVPSLVYHRAETERGRRYGLKFVDWLGFLTQLPCSLQALFNRRRDHRLEPGPESPIEVTVEGGEEPFQVTAYLRDLSTAGLSFHAAAAADDLLSKDRHVKVSLCLPDSEEPLEFRADIRYSTVIGTSICYGACFDAELTENFQEKQETLRQYIAEVVRQTLNVLDL